MQGVWSGHETDISFFAFHALEGFLAGDALGLCLMDQPSCHGNQAVFRRAALVGADQQCILGIGQDGLVRKLIGETVSLADRILFAVVHFSQGSSPVGCIAEPGYDSYIHRCGIGKDINVLAEVDAGFVR